MSWLKERWKDANEYVEKPLAAAGLATGAYFAAPYVASAASSAAALAKGAGLSKLGAGAIASAKGIYDFAKPYLPSLLPSLLQGGATKYGYDTSLEGIQQQNATAKEIADKANAMSQANAREQMSFQERMSNTSHQREILDLKAAGLNPILSGTGGMGSSTPSGAQGDVKQAPVQSEGGAISSAMDVFRTIAQTMKTNADREFVQSVQTPNTQAQTNESKSRTTLNAAQTQLVDATIEKTNADTGKALQETFLASANTNLSVQNSKNAKQMEELLKKQNIGQETTNKILNENLSVAAAAAAEALIREEISETEFGRIMIIIDRIIETVSPFGKIIPKNRPLKSPRG